MIKPPQALYWPRHWVLLAILTKNQPKAVVTWLLKVAYVYTGKFVHATPSPLAMHESL